MTDRDIRVPLWISLLEVAPLPESEHADMPGAYTTGVAPARTAQEATERFRRALLDLDFVLIEAEETELLADRLAEYSVSEEVERLAQVAVETDTVQFGTFHTWESEDPDDTLDA